uniref:Uncharacterized protein n=1 Tax=Thalassionema nitzschioides TaxID=33649 RepID=A0A7S1E4N4_9STRA|mmetsp:Transcript_6962/g.5780  ORF Transcript_6962/g.5780 Transcript_6962/m.5780 type:complete len:109 (+) Transcript_6962:74-400(+)
MGDGARLLLANARRLICAKKAIREGTFGTFDSNLGVGWDPKWDNPGSLGKMLPPKNLKRSLERREARAQNIDAKVEKMDENIDKHYRDIEAKKPEPTFENYFKSFMRK